MTCIIVGGCAWGPNLETFPPAHEPEGIAARLQLDGDLLRAELLAVDEDAVLVLVDGTPPHRLAGRLARVPFTEIPRAEFAHAGDVPRTELRYIVALFAFMTYACPFAGNCGDVETQPEAYVGTGVNIADDSELLHRLRLLSRYPQGVDDQLLARLVATYGQVATP